MAQTFRFLCALLLLGAFCGLPRTGGVDPKTSPPVSTPDGGNTTSPPVSTPDGGNATSPPVSTPDGGNTTSPPLSTPDGSNTTSPPVSTPDGSNTTTPPVSTPDGGNTTTPPVSTPDGSNTTTPPVSTPDGGNTTTPPVSTPDGGNTTTPPVSTPDGGNTTSPPLSTPDGSNTTSPPVSTPDGSNTTSPPVSTPDGSNTTTPPVSTPDGGNATSPPVSTPDGGNTTSPPLSTPDGSNTTSPPVSTPDGGNATSPPVSTPDGGNATSPGGTTPQPTTAPPDACLSNPCGPGSTCATRALGTFECLCLAGAYYDQSSCVIGKVFPGKVTLKNVTFTEELRNKMSAEFKQKSQLVSDTMQKAFEGNNSYVNTTVLRFLPAGNARLSSRNGPAAADVQIVFELAANITESAVSEMIRKCAECSVTYAVRGDLCVDEPCDPTTTKCLAGEGLFSCSCESGYVKSSLSDRVCTACLSGQQAVDGKCIDCPFGYSGFNCAENWKLVLVIVGSVLGGVLLITLIALITVVVRSKKHFKASSTADIGKPYISHSSANSPLVNGDKGVPAVAGMPRIPRATANKSWNSGSDLEMTPSGSRQNLISSGRNSRHYGNHDGVVTLGQSGPQNNPYTQNRAQSNPYASNGGHDNPYYKYDSR